MASKLFGNTGSGRYSGKKSGAKRPQHTPEEKPLADEPDAVDLNIGDMPADELNWEDAPADSAPADELLIDGLHDSEPSEESAKPEAAPPTQPNQATNR